ncbi:MAG: hypothetical protein IT258_15215 [Saprospiraceae bacterium]|nr:hypothetical protein [Saprospiraceae bacterium]
MKILKTLLLIIGLLLCGFTICVLAYWNMWEFATRSSNQYYSSKIDFNILISDLVILACILYSMYKMVIAIKRMHGK